MEFKKLMLVLFITIAVLIGILFGISYGWYAYANAKTDVSGDTLKSKPTIIFAQTEHIFYGKTLPILDDDRYTYGNKNSFTVTLGENLKDYQTGIKIELVDLKMSEELKIANYKYELLQDGISIKTGDFSTIGQASTLELMPMTVLTPNTYPKTYTFELVIWLSDDGSNQNDLMNKAISARINVTSAEKK